MAKSVNYPSMAVLNASENNLVKVLTTTLNECLTPYFTSDSLELMV